MSSAKQLITYVFPIYNEAGNIELLHSTVSKLLTTREKQFDFEIIYINDGSIDNSLEVLQGIQLNDKRVCIINLARNFGHQFAVTAGLDHASGDAVVIMDSDMQDPPSVSLELIDKWQEGFDVVYAERRSRQDGIFKKLSASAFYWVLNRVADIHIPANTGDFRLIDRRVVDELKRFKEHSRFLRGMVSFVGFKQTSVLFDRDERHVGATGYPLRKMIRFAGDGIFSFSYVPLRLITSLGYLMASLSFLGILYALFIKIFLPQTAVQGWTFVVIAIFFIGGVQLVMLGVLGSYIGRIYNETLDRPLYVVDKILKRK